MMSGSASNADRWVSETQPNESDTLRIQKVMIVNVSIPRDFSVAVLTTRKSLSIS